MRIGAVIHPTAVAGSARGPQLKRFSRHMIEMTVAMLLGMAVLGMVFRALHLAVFGTGFDAAWHEHTELAVFAMTFNMTLPMVGLMRYRGHAWERCGEMAAAMFVLAFALLVPFWLGLLSADAVLPLEMALMLPAMIAVMALRFDEYAGPPDRHRPQPNARPEPPFARDGRGGLLDLPLLQPAALHESLANEGVMGHELRRVVVRVGLEADQSAGPVGERTSEVLAELKPPPVLLFDGPGQGRNLVRDAIPMRPDWENVVRPVLDYALERPEVDADRVVLAGWSWGGFLAPRAAAFEHRIAALWADPGQWDQRDRLPLQEDEKATFPDGADPERFVPMENHLRSDAGDPLMRWRLLQRGLWVHGVSTLFEYFAELARYELSPVAAEITCPTVITLAEDDPIATGAPKLHAGIGAQRKTLISFTSADGTGGHCEFEGRRRFHQHCFDWLDETLHQP